MRTAGGAAGPLTLRDYPVEEFLWGLGAGTLALLAATARAWRHDGAPVTGLVMTAAALGAIGRTWSVIPATLLGLVGVAVALAWLTPRRSETGACSLAVAALLATPFASVLAVDASSTGWVRGLLVAGGVLGPLAASRTDVAWGDTGLPPVLYAVSAAGVFAAVPDTEQAAVLLGASAPIALAGWPLGRARLGPTGAGTATALLVWVAAVGGRGREPSIVGAVACLGLLVTLPAGRWLALRTGHLDAVHGRRDGVVALVVIVDVAVVAVASRVAGVTDDLDVAAAVAAVSLLAALVAGMWLSTIRW